MPTTDVQGTSSTILNAIAGFLQRHRRILLIVLLAVVIIVVGLFVYLETRSAREERARVAVEEVQELFDDWNATEDDSDRAALAVRIDTAVERILADYPRFAAAQRALLIRGNVHWENEAWEEAAADYAQAGSGFRNSYLTPIALFNAAAASEQAGDIDRAVEYLDTLTTNHSGAEVPRALFTLGRIAESTGDTDAAREYYSRLMDNHAGSTWTNLARNRIIALSIMN